MKHFLLPVTVLITLSLAWIPATGAQPDDALAGTSWVLVSVDGTTMPDDRMTLSFDANGSAGGNGGCNSFGSDYEIDGGSIHFTMLISTMMACDMPVMDREQTYFAALQTATGYELDGNRLVITYGEGQELVFKSAAARLDGTQWTLVLLGGEDVLGDTPLTLEFGDDQRASGSAGCNLFSGGYATEGDKIAFTAIISTERACLDNDFNAQERAYLDALQSATGYEQSEDQLTITYGDGEMLVFEAVPVITVEVTYLVRMALPPEATITVTLQDVSTADTPAEDLASTTVTTDGANVPITVKLPYDPGDIEEGHDYVVRADAVTITLVKAG
jgi:heat shock protein HslJ